MVPGHHPNIVPVTNAAHFENTVFYTLKDGHDGNIVLGA